MLVLLLGRPELVRTAGALTRLADAEVHTLPPLRGADAARLLTSYLGGGKLPQADTDRLLATAQGNPFYLAELVTLLMERGALTPARRRANAGAVGWRLAAGSLGSRLLSRDLAAVLAARIDALPPTPGRCCATPRWSATPCRPARWRRCGSSAPAATAGRRRWSRSSSSGPSTSCCNAGCCTASRGGYAFATPLMREAAYAGVARPTWPSGTPAWPAGRRRRTGPLATHGAGRLSLTESDRDDFVADARRGAAASWPTR